MVSSSKSRNVLEVMKTVCAILDLKLSDHMQIRKFKNVKEGLNAGWSLKNSNKQIAITSIGIDGENKDQVTHTHKPEIEVYEGMLFVTPEILYKKRKLVAEILEVSNQNTALGKLITARAKTEGKVIVSGPTTNKSLIACIDKMQFFGADLTIIDGNTGKALDMGSPYDFFGVESWVNFEGITFQQNKNRELLQKVMLKYGFRYYPKEWWHFTLIQEPFPETYFDFVIN